MNGYKLLGAVAFGLVLSAANIADGHAESRDDALYNALKQMSYQNSDFAANCRIMHQGYEKLPAESRDSLSEMVIESHTPKDLSPEMRKAFQRILRNCAETGEA